jgi:LemA protein
MIGRCRRVHGTLPASRTIGCRPESAWILLERATMNLRLLLLVAAVVAVLGGCQSYDVLVTKDQVCQQKWADVEAQLQRRADLVPNLVAVVRGSAAHEERTLDQVVQARAAATSVTLKPEDMEDADKMAAFAKAQDSLKGALSRLLVVQEAYPDLKANAAFHDLQVQIEGTENRILRAREEYDAAVSDFNAALEHVRGKVVNRATGRPFKPRPYFSASPEALTAPKVAF